MVDKANILTHGTIAAEVEVRFKYTVIHGENPTKRSPEYKAITRSLSLNGLVFETKKMEADGFHLSFSSGTFARNFLEIALDLGRRCSSVEVLGQVEWYERRSTAASHSFAVGVGFVDIQVEALTVLRDFLQQTQAVARRGSQRRGGE